MKESDRIVRHRNGFQPICMQLLFTLQIDSDGHWWHAFSALASQALMIVPGTLQSLCSICSAFNLVLDTRHTTLNMA